MYQNRSLLGKFKTPMVGLSEIARRYLTQYVDRANSYLVVPLSTLQCPTYSCRNPAGIRSFQRNSGGIHRNSSGILQESSHSTGIKQTKVEILYLTLHFVLIYRTTYLSLLSLVFLHLFKSVSHLQSVYSSTLPLGYNFK